jgi:endonuclease-3 related protein
VSPSRSSRRRAPDAGVRPVALDRSARRRLLLAAHRRALRTYGPLGWWPGRSALEISLGAILTQNTAWTNVEKAIRALRAEGLLRPGALDRLPEPEIAARIRPAGYFNQKARTVGAFLAWLRARPGRTVREKLRGRTAELRESLLAVRGIGPETADSILLYAADHPVFVVDAYTRRILARHGLVPETIGYEALRAWFEEALPADVGLYNELHAQIVNVGKDHCRKRAPRCAGCPFRALPFRGSFRPAEEEDAQAHDRRGEEARPPGTGP